MFRFDKQQAAVTVVVWLSRFLNVGQSILVANMLLTPLNNTADNQLKSDARFYFFFSTKKKPQHVFEIGLLLKQTLVIIFWRTGTKISFKAASELVQRPAGASNIKKQDVKL